MEHTKEFALKRIVAACDYLWFHYKVKWIVTQTQIYARGHCEYVLLVRLARRSHSGIHY